MAIVIATETAPVVFVEPVLVSVALVSNGLAPLPTYRPDLAMEKLAEADVDIFSPPTPSREQLTSTWP